MVQEPIAVCRYGWGQILRLYQDYLDLNGTAYALTKLVSVQSVPYHLLGFASARLELQFKDRQVVLRGIGELETLQKIERYLIPWCVDDPSHRSVLSGEGVGYQPAVPSPVQSSYWEYKNMPEQNEMGLSTQAAVQHKELQPCPPAQVVSLEPPTRVVPLLHGLRLYRLKLLQKERLQRQHGFDVEALAWHLRSEMLPQIAVSPRLQEGEIAYYSSRATLCGEPFGNPERARYRAKDKGNLILTNKRLIYLGQRRQIVVRYEQLLNVVYLHSAVELFAEYWSRTQLFEMQRPLECTMYLTNILKRFRQQADSYLNLKQSSAELYRLAPVIPVAYNQVQWSSVRQLEAKN